MFFNVVCISWKL